LTKIPEKGGSVKSLKPNWKTLRSELVSGFATGLFSIPEGMAYAKLAGVNPVYGLYSGMITTIVASLTTGSVLMISTLTSAIALSTASVIQVAGIQHSQMPQS
jgi:SulP family sulfate permease